MCIQVTNYRPIYLSELNSKNENGVIVIFLFFNTG